MHCSAVNWSSISSIYIMNYWISIHSHFPRATKHQQLNRILEVWLFCPFHNHNSFFSISFFDSMYSNQTSPKIPNNIPHFMYYFILKNKLDFSNWVTIQPRKNHFKSTPEIMLLVCWSALVHSSLKCSLHHWKRVEGMVSPVQPKTYKNEG